MCGVKTKKRSAWRNNKLSAWAALITINAIASVKWNTKRGYEKCKCANARTQCNSVRWRCGVWTSLMIWFVVQLYGCICSYVRVLRVPNTPRTLYIRIALKASNVIEFDLVLNFAFYFKMWFVRSTLLLVLLPRYLNRYYYDKIIHFFLRFQN